jgi:hypothetical protein
MAERQPEIADQTLLAEQCFRRFIGGNDPLPLDDQDRIVDRLDQPTDRLRRLFRPEIGRASCRERVS